MGVSYTIFLKYVLRKNIIKCIIHTSTQATPMAIPAIGLFHFSYRLATVGAQPGLASAYVQAPVTAPMMPSFLQHDLGRDTAAYSVALFAPQHENWKWE